MPNILGIDGPVMSASIMPALSFAVGEQREHRNQRFAHTAFAAHYSDNIFMLFSLSLALNSSGMFLISVLFIFITATAQIRLVRYYRAIGVLLFQHGRLVLMPRRFYAFLPRSLFCTSMDTSREGA